LEGKKLAGDPGSENPENHDHQLDPHLGVHAFLRELMLDVRRSSMTRRGF
jgi:hypothetical protein